MFWKILYDMWYDCITMNRRYNLNNFTEFPKNLRGKCQMFNTYVYCRFSAIFNLATPTGLSVCNCSHSYLTDLWVHINIKIDAYIPFCWFIMFNRGLVRTGTRFWYYNKGRHYSNTRIFFTIVEKNYISSIKSTNLIEKEHHYDKIVLLV